MEINFTLKELLELRNAVISQKNGYAVIATKCTETAIGKEMSKAVEEDEQIIFKLNAKIREKTCFE